MKNKYKITGFARLLIFLILFTPIAYIGASYYQGEDGIEKVKSIVNGISKDDTATRIYKKEREIKKLEEQLQVLNQELAALKNDTN